MTTVEKWNGVFLFNIMCVIAVGCGNQASDQPGLGLVTGTVTMDGEPLPSVMVVFSPEKGRSSMGTTDPEGNYEMIYVRDTKGAKLGTHKISITTVQEGSSEESEEVTQFKEIIPARYNAKTTLTEEVKAGENVIDFALTSK